MNQQLCLCILALTFTSVVGRYWVDLPAVSCPEYFSYVKTPKGDIEGRISIPYEPMPEVNLVVNCTMFGYFGPTKTGLRLRLLSNPMELLTKPDANLEYELLFPTQENIPHLAGIELNGMNICRTPDILPRPGVMPSITTKMYAKHSIQFQSGMRSSSGDPIEARASGYEVTDETE